MHQSKSNETSAIRMNDVCSVLDGARVGKSIPLVTRAIRVNLSTDWIRRDKRLAKRRFDDECSPNDPAVRTSPSILSVASAAAAELCSKEILRKVGRWSLDDAEQLAEEQADAAIPVPCKRKVVKNHVFSTYLINNVEYITILYENLLFFLKNSNFSHFSST